MRRLLAVLAIILALGVTGDAQTVTTAPREPLSTASSNVSSTGSTMNAADEDNFAIGEIYFDAQTGTKTCSAAGSCRIFYLTASGITWANGSTNFRLGIQDVGADGLFDGTFDVHADLVPGVETIASSLLHVATMESGTKTITYGQLVAIGGIMTARGGTDAVTFDRVIGPTIVSYNRPYGVHLDTASRDIPQFLIEFDDDTYGWINPVPLLYNVNLTAIASVSFSSASTPDEYVATFSLPYAVRICGVGFHMGATDTTDVYEVNVFTDPYGTPTKVASTPLTPDPDQDFAPQAGPYIFALAAPYELAANTVLGVGMRPTTGTLTWSYHDLTTGFQALKNAQPFTTIKMASRTDNTGAFAETQTYHLPDLYISTCGLAAGGGGGNSSSVGDLLLALSVLGALVGTRRMVRI